MRSRYALDLPLGPVFHDPKAFARIDVDAISPGQAYFVARNQAIDLARILLDWAMAPRDLHETAEGAHPYRLWKEEA